MEMVTKEFSTRKPLANGLHSVATVFFIISTLLLYDTNKPLLDYMEYLPVYRVERLWERDSEATFWFGQQFGIKTQQQ